MNREMETKKNCYVMGMCIECSSKIISLSNRICVHHSMYTRIKWSSMLLMAVVACHLMHKHTSFWWQRWLNKKRCKLAFQRERKTMDALLGTRHTRHTDGWCWTKRTGGTFFRFVQKGFTAIYLCELCWAVCRRFRLDWNTSDMLMLWNLSQIHQREKLPPALTSLICYSQVRICTA